MVSNTAIFIARFCLFGYQTRLTDALNLQKPNKISSSHFVEFISHLQLAKFNINKDIMNNVLSYIFS